MAAFAVIVFYSYWPAQLSFRAIWDNPFPVHPIAMSLSFLVIFPDVIAMAMRAHRASKSDDKATKARSEQLRGRHAALAFMCYFCALIGFVAIFSNKIKNKRDHFATLHGQFGILALALLFFQVVFTGIAQLNKALISVVNREKVRKVHKINSYFLSLAVAAAWYSALYANGGAIAAQYGEIMRHALGGAAFCGIVMVSISANSE